MAEQLREGNYSRFGASRLADGICFTFEGEKDSDCAIRLYEKQGFATMGKRKNFYEKPTEDAYVMVRQPVVPTGSL